MRVALLSMVVCLSASAVPSLADTPPRAIDAATKLEADVKPGEAHAYSLHMKAGESAEIAVVQEGVDVSVEWYDAGGTLRDTVDSPNGRSGDEPVEIIADRDGDYVLRVQPIGAQEPAGRYRLEMRVFRDVDSTRQMLAARRAARQAAGTWLRAHAERIADTGMVDTQSGLKHFDALIARARVIGLGEATHGSREFGDLRLALTKRLVARNGIRVVALEGASASRALALQPYVDGKAFDAAYESLVEDGWIGRRSRRELVEWAREWNLRHPKDRVRIVGVDAQDNAASRRAVTDFIAAAYGPDAAGRWKPVEADLAAADAQTAVFGDSGVSAATRTAVIELLALLNADRPYLVKRFGAPRVELTLGAALELAQFADFNAGGGTVSHSRDWYMATNVLRALEEAAPNARVVYWAHNAHVAHPAASSRTAGALLRSTLGCGYVAIAATFGRGAFTAQIPNDREDRLAVSELPSAPDESIEGVIAADDDHGTLASWGCEAGELPAWLTQKRTMHWVGGLYAPGSIASSAFRSFDLTADFDGIAYLPRTTAEAIPTDRPLVPARVR